MKVMLLSFCLCLFNASFSRVQAKLSDNQNETMIDLYFKTYSGEPGYQVNTLSEPMIKRSNDLGSYSSQSIANIMKQIKLFKSLNFDSSAEHSKEILLKIQTAVNADHLYKEYYRSEANGVTSAIIYTREKNKKIEELVSISVSKKHFVVNCFVGDNIDMASIRALLLNK